MTIYSVQAGNTLSDIAKANNMTMKQLLDLNPELKSNPNLITVGQKIKLDKKTSLFQNRENSTSQKTQIQQPQTQQTQAKTQITQTDKKQEKHLNIGGEIIGMGLAIEHLAPESDLDRLNAARKEMTKAIKENTYYTSKSGKSYMHTKGPTAERQFKAVENFQKAQKAYDEAENLIKSDKELKAARKEVTKAIKENTYYTSKSGKSYMHTKGPTAERQFKAVENFQKAQKAYDGARSGKNSVNAIKTTRTLSKASKVMGKAATPIAIAAEGYNVYTEYKKGGEKAAAKQVVRSSGAIFGAWAGAKGGAAVGAAVGSIFPGAGNAIGAAIGGVIGGVAGYFASDEIMKKVVK